MLKLILPQEWPIRQMHGWHVAVQGRDKQHSGRYSRKQKEQEMEQKTQGRKQSSRLHRGKELEYYSREGAGVICSSSAKKVAPSFYYPD